MGTKDRDRPPEPPSGTADEELAAAAQAHPLTEEDLDAITEEYPGWFAWSGVISLYYARRPRSTPPMVVRSPTLDGLREAIEKAEEERGLR